MRSQAANGDRSPWFLARLVAGGQDPRMVRLFDIANIVTAAVWGWRGRTHLPRANGALGCYSVKEICQPLS